MIESEFVTLCRDLRAKWIGLEDGPPPSIEEDRRDEFEERTWAFLTHRSRCPL